MESGVHTAVANMVSQVKQWFSKLHRYSSTYFQTILLAFFSPGPIKNSAM